MKRILPLLVVSSMLFFLFNSVPADAPALPDVLFPPVDRLAADAEAARYRTHRIDPAVLTIPKEITLAKAGNYQTYLRQLVAYFMQDADNQYHVVKRIHDWISDTIAYELFSNINIPEFLVTGKTNCSGYTLLFQEMAAYAGIRADIVFGFSRTYAFAGGEQGNHSWNVVHINGKRYFVDTTHDARARVRNGLIGEKRPYSDDEFFIHPRFKILINYPYDSAYQLLDPPVSFEDYMKAPRLKPAFIKYGLGMADPSFTKRILRVNYALGNLNIMGIFDGVETGGRAERLAVDCPAEVEIKLTVSSPDETYDKHAVVERKDNQPVLVFSAPDKGVYRVQLDVRLRGSDYWENAYNFILVEKVGPGPQVAH